MIENKKTVYPDSKVVRFLGRTAKIGGMDGIFFNWSGSGVEFIFTGADCEVLLFGDRDFCENEPDGRAYISVFIDDLPYSSARFPLEKGEKWYRICEGMDDTQHKVRIVKDTEAGYGRAAILAIGVKQGADIRPTKAKGLSFEFIGDSITCGYGNISSNENKVFSTREESFSLTYAQILADLLDADLSVVAASGNGICHDYGCNTHNLIPQLYPYSDKMLFEHYGKTPEPMSFQNDKKDIVFIKLGQNDAQYCSGADIPPDLRTGEELERRVGEFEDSAVEFVRQVIKCRPETPIIYVYESDMYLKDRVAGAIKTVARDIPDIKIFGFEIQNKRQLEGVGANGHWSAQTHARVAGGLEKTVREVLCLK